MLVASFLETLDHDWAVTNGNLTICTDARAVSQHIEARLRLFLGEWFLNVLEGVPYFQEVFIKNPDVPLVKTLLSKVVTDTPGVSGLTQADFSFDPKERILYYSISCVTNTSQTIDINSSISLGNQ